MLMIGGEFDLSAGAMTGAMGILVVILSKEAGEFGGAGLTLWIAIPISFAVAMAIGYMNGWLVEKTRLPSFTITLATYYVLIGAKLGFSKLIVDQVQVGDISDANGYRVLVRRSSPPTWDRTEHSSNSRDKVYTVCLLLAIALIVVAVVEMQFSRRREAFKPAGLIQFVVGAGITIAGIVTLHVTDGLSGNWLGAAIIAVGDDRRPARLRQRGGSSRPPATVARCTSRLTSSSGSRSASAASCAAIIVALADGRLRRRELLLPVHQAGLPGGAVHALQRDRLHGDPDRRRQGAAV